MGNTYAAAYNYGNDFLNYMSYNICPEKPTVYLVTKELDIPAQEKGILEELISVIYAVLGAVIIPAKNINDKKFSVHKHQSNFNFVTNGQPDKPKTMPFYEKVLIYISKSSNKIIEPLDQRIIDNIMIGDDGDNYAIPVNLWYTFTMKNKKKLYFYVHISPLKGYKGVLFACNREDNDLLEKIKEKVSKHYTNTLGKKTKSKETIADL